MSNVQTSSPYSPAPGPRSPAYVFAQRPGLTAAAIAVVALSWSCVAPHHRIITSTGAHTVPDVLEAHRPDPERNVTVIELDHSQRTSRHLVWVRDREQPHTHPRNDIVVTILRGHGTIWLDGLPVLMRTGDEVVIDAGVPHYFINESGEPAAAFVVYAPPSDGSPPQPVGRGPK